MPTTTTTELLPTKRWHSRKATIETSPLFLEISTEPSQIYSSLQPSSESENFADEEVPKTTIREASIRRAKANAHVQARLLRLRAETAQEKFPQSSLVGSTTFSTPDIPALPYAPENSYLGLLVPLTWRLLPHTSLLDRLYLHELNPCAFDERGVLRKKFRVLERPRGLPLLYWNWLGGETRADAECWASGWTREGPTLKWIRRWKRGELTRKEIDGGKRVGFALDELVCEYVSFGV